MTIRIFYAASGHADLIESHHHWKAGTHNPTEVSITFSGQVQSFCREIGAQTLMVSPNPTRARLVDGRFRIEHRPKPRGLGIFHLEEVRYGLILLALALRFRARVAIMDSGSTYFFMMGLFRLFGIRVVPVLHNTLWPAGFPPASPIRRFVRWLDSFFWRWGPAAAIAVSPEAERQLESLRRRKTYPVYQTRAQFPRDYFERIPPPPPHGQRPFTIMFIGRVDRIKGVLDIPAMAKIIEGSHPGLVRWIVCGKGPASDDLVRLCRELGVEDMVELRGWVSLDDLVGVYARSHASIVPTRSLFAEGLAMSAAEAILAGRPVITNPVVPALELLRPAALEARTDDVASHAEAVLRLALDGDLYARLQDACVPLAHQFYDRSLGLTAVLARSLGMETAINAAPPPPEGSGLRAAFVCSGDPDDVLTWSGTPFHMKQSLEGHFDFVDVKASFPTWFEKLAPWVQRLSGGRLDLYRSHIALFALRKAKARVDAVKPDIVFSVANSPLTSLLSRRHKTIHVSDATFEAISNYYPGFDRLAPRVRRRAQEIESAAIEGAFLALYPSQWARDSAVSDYRAEESRALLVPWGPNLAAASHRHHTSPEIRLLFVGVDWLRKGGEIALEAVRELNARGVRCHLDIVGASRSAALSEVPPNVTFHGFLKTDVAKERERLEQLYAGASLFLLPTRQECLGMVFAEAAHYGLPSIAYATGGVTTVVKHGETGILLEPGSSGRDFADAIEALIGDAPRLARMSEAALEDARTRLNWDAWASEVAKLVTAKLKR